MNDTFADTTAETGPEAWLAGLERLAEDSGDFVPLGTSHWAFLVDEAPTLIVSFETLAEARAREGAMPLAHGIAAAHGWSHLCILSDGTTFWRDPAVWRYFDRLVDDAFFEDFDRVLFMGSGLGGYAAAAFSVTAPGASVLAFAPRATLNPMQAGWDSRHRGLRRLDCTSRYGYAPDMVDGAERMFLVHDPRHAPDTMHAALFHAPWITRLDMRFGGEDPAHTLSQFNALVPLVEAACEGRLTPELFARLWRTRRDYGPYLRRLLRHTDDIGRIAFSEMLCRNVTSRLNGPRFARRLAQIEADRAATAAPAEAGA